MDESKRQWTFDEFGTVDFGDKRLDKRLKNLSADLSLKPLAPISQATEDWDSCKAAYRFFENDKVDMKKILAPHTKNTLKRCQNHPFVLAVNDTTTFNYSAHPSKKGFGHIGRGAYKGTSKAKGVYAHTTMALSPQGVPLGILSNYFWNRTHQDKESDAEKESARWIESVNEIEDMSEGELKFISVGDRESDFNDYFLNFSGKRNHFLVRSKTNRKILESENKKLWDYMKGRKIKTEFEVKVESKSKVEGSGGWEKKKGKLVRNGKKRIARLKVQYEDVNIDMGSKGRYPMWVLRVSEDLENSKENVEPIEWILLTSVEISSSEVAELMVQFYDMRWVIETYFKTLKSGCKVEDCRLDNYEKITKYITLMAVVAWRLLWMVHIGRIEGEAPCTKVLSEIEWKTLFRVTNKSKKLPDGIPTVKEAIIRVAMLGGFLARKNDGMPGVTTIWRGWQRLTDMTMTIELLL